MSLFAAVESGPQTMITVLHRIKSFEIYKQIFCWIICSKYLVQNKAHTINRRRRNRLVFEQKGRAKNHVASICSVRNSASSPQTTRKLCADEFLMKKLDIDFRWTRPRTCLSDRVNARYRLQNSVGLHWLVLAWVHPPSTKMHKTPVKQLTRSAKSKVDRDICDAIWANKAAPYPIFYVPSLPYRLCSVNDRTFPTRKGLCPGRWPYNVVIYFMPFWFPVTSVHAAMPVLSLRRI